MSSKGTQEILDAIDPNYQTSKMNDIKREVVAQALPSSDSQERRKAYKKGYNTLKSRKAKRHLFSRRPNENKRGGTLNSYKNKTIKRTFNIVRNYKE